MTAESHDELLPIFLDGGVGDRLMKATEAYLSDYVFSPDEGSDHDLTEFEQMLMEDFIGGLFADEAICSILQECARGLAITPTGGAFSAGMRRAAEIARAHTVEMRDRRYPSDSGEEIADAILAAIPVAPAPEGEIDPSGLNDHLSALRNANDGWAITIWKDGGWKLWRTLDARYAESDPDFFASLPGNLIQDAIDALAKTGHSMRAFAGALASIRSRPAVDDRQTFKISTPLLCLSCGQPAAPGSAP